MVSQQINEVINNLSNKLGITTDKILPYIAKHSFAKGVSYIVISSMLLIFAIWLSKRVFRECKKDWKERNDAIQVFGGLVLAISIVIGLILLPNGVTRVISPEYTGVEDILEIITNK